MKALVISQPVNSGAQFGLYQAYYDDGSMFPDYYAYLLLSVLNRERVECDMLDLSAVKEGYLEKAVEKSGKYDCILFFTNSLTWAKTKEISDAIKKEHPDIVITASGLHPTLFDEYILKNSSIDFCIRGDGESSAASLLKWLRKKTGVPSDIPGISYKDTGEIVRTKDSRILSDNKLEHLPCDFFPFIPDGVYDAISLETSRGYPFFSPLYSMTDINEWRAIPPTGIIERITRATEYPGKSKKNYIQLTDLNFTAKEKRIFDLAQELKKKAKKELPKLQYMTRCSDLVTESLVECLPGFTHKIILTPQCGYNKGLGNLRKGFTCVTIEDSARLLAKHKMSDRAEFAFILGFPWETMKEVHKTVEFAEHLKGIYGVKIRFNIFRLLPGSVFWDDKYKKGEVEISMFDTENFDKSQRYKNLSSPGLTDNDYEEICSLMRL